MHDLTGVFQMQWYNWKPRINETEKAIDPSDEIRPRRRTFSPGEARVAKFARSDATLSSSFSELKGGTAATPCTCLRARIRVRPWSGRFTSITKIHGASRRIKGNKRPSFRARSLAGNSRSSAAFPKCER